MKSVVRLLLIASTLLPASAIAGTKFDGSYVGSQNAAGANCRGNGINITLIVENGLLRNKFDTGNHTVAVDDSGHFNELSYPLNDPFGTIATLKAGQIADGAIIGEADYVGTISCAYKFTATKLAQ